MIGNVSGRGSTGVATLPGLARRLVIAWWRQLAAVAAACGIVAATIAGAIGVGERLRGGLASLAVSRLGGIEAAVVAEGFFGPPLVDRLATAVGEAGSVVPAILIEVTVDRTGEPGRPRASAPARLLACDDPAALGFAGVPGPRDEGVLLNRVVAESLAAVAGDTVVVRVPQPSMVPADSPLGRRTLRSRAARVRVDAVLPDEGLGRFAIRPGQVTGPLVVSTRDLAEKLLGEVGPLEGHIANLALAVPRQPGPSGRLAERLRAGLEPTLADYGLRLEPVGDGSVVRLTSDRLVIPPEADRAAEALLTPFGGRPSLVFLANAMRPLPAEPAASIPYSTVAGIPEGSWPSGGLVDDAGEPLQPPGPGEIIIDRWMADDLAEQGRPVGPGDWLRLEWFLPETLHGRVSESAERLRVSGIAAMRGLAVARDLVPEVKGVTDEASIADWDPPFPFDASRVRSTPPFDQDDRYWKTYAATPKAFVGIATARRLAASRFGQTTAWHLPRDSIDDLESLRADLAAAIRPQAMGLAVVPLREAALAASSGSTPFGGLFIALSMFLVAAGLLLLWLLMSLLVTTHVDEIGTLAAVGFGPRRLSALLTLVAAVAAAGGVLLGVAVGPTWSAVLLGLLGEAWDRSVAGGSAVAFGGNLQPGWSLVAGGLAALVITLLAVATACRRFASRPPGRLFAADGEPCRPAAARRLRIASGLAVIGAAVAALVGSRLEGFAVAAFMLAGTLAITGGLGFVRASLAGGGLVSAAGPPQSLAGLAVRGLKHRPKRAFLVVAIVAVASFLVLAVSSFSLAVPDDLDVVSGPTGGWDLLVSFGHPTGLDPQDPAAAAAVGLDEKQRRLLERCTIVRLRSSGGSSADCTNLYATAEPRVLGLPSRWIDRGGFSFTDHRPLPAGETNPWRLLEAGSMPSTDDGPQSGPIPVVLDEATATWALRLGGVGSRFTIDDDAGDPVELEIVGLLEAGILQGELLVSEENFERIFPGRSGYALAMIESPDEPRAVADAVRAAWIEEGTTLEWAADRLRSLFAVQNIFLAAFQALGGLGLLLGTAGVSAVAAEGVFERRAAFAVMRAVGFALSRIRRLVVLEVLAMVAVGLAVGSAAGLLAIWPTLIAGRGTLPLGWLAAEAAVVLATAAAAGSLAVRLAGIPSRP